MAISLSFGKINETEIAIDWFLLFKNVLFSSIDIRLWLWESLINSLRLLSFVLEAVSVFEKRILIDWMIVFLKDFTHFRCELSNSKSTANIIYLFTPLTNTVILFQPKILNQNKNQTSFLIIWESINNSSNNSFCKNICKYEIIH